MAWVAMTTLVVIGIVGLSIDWGKLALNVHELQNAADTAALAGAQVVRFDVLGARQNAIALASWNQAEQRAVSVADNPDNYIDGELVIGRWIRQERLFFETLLSPNAVKVVASRRDQRREAPMLSLVFGPAFGTRRAGASCHAIGWARGSSGAGIICLAADPRSLPGWQNKGTGFRLPGTARIDLRGFNKDTGDPMLGDVQVNAISEDLPWSALKVDGISTSIYAGELNIVGTTNPDPEDAGTWAGIYGDPGEPFSVNPESPALADPLAGIEPPDISVMAPGCDIAGNEYFNPITKTFTTVAGVAGEVITLTPGYYPGGINTKAGTIVLNEGVYALGGGDDPNRVSGLVVTGDAAVIGMGGIMVYITGDPDGSVTGTATQYGRVYLTDTGRVELISPGDMSPGDMIGVDGESGVVIWQDRNNHNHAILLGASDSLVKGTLYFGYNAVTIGGTPAQMGNQVIAGALEVHGTSNLKIAYDGRNAIQAFRSILVE